MRTQVGILLFAFFISSMGAAKVQVANLNYKSEVGLHKSKLYNPGGKNLPGVLILPEWWGLNKDMEGKGEFLASQGYVVLVADLYGGGQTAESPDSASALLKMIDGKKARQSFMAALLQLKKVQNVDSNKIAVIGYGFGGGLATDMARRKVPVRAFVNFFGAVAPPEAKKKTSIQRPYLWIKGEHDAYIDKKMEESLQKEMAAFKSLLQIETYKNTFHSFTNPMATAIGKRYHFPIDYSSSSTKKSWALLKTFLSKNLK